MVRNGYRSWINNDIVKKAINDYKNGTETQKFYAEKYDIPYTIFTKYFYKEKILQNGGTIKKSDSTTSQNPDKLIFKKKIDAKHEFSDNNILGLPIKKKKEPEQKREVYKLDITNMINDAKNTKTNFNAN